MGTNKLVPHSQLPDGWARIGTVSKATGLSRYRIETLISEGLVEVRRTEGGHRILRVEEVMLRFRQYPHLDSVEFPVPDLQPFEETTVDRRRREAAPVRVFHFRSKDGKTYVFKKAPADNETAMHQNYLLAMYMAIREWRIGGDPDHVFAAFNVEIRDYEGKVAYPIDPELLVRLPHRDIRVADEDLDISDYEPGKLFEHYADEVEHDDATQPPAGEHDEPHAD
jgi:DNA-binding transcriptional MerR regulator